MYLPAITIGCAVPVDRFDATVHSVFQSSLNLRLNNVDRLLTLTVSSEDDLPQGIRLEAPRGFTFEKFQSGESAVCRDGILHLENTSLTVHLGGARRYKCDLPALMADASNPVVSASWSLVWEALNKRQKLTEAEVVAEDLLRFDAPAKTGMSRTAGEALRNLLDTTRRYGLTDTMAIEALIGLGPGLTPSGDDLLVGYMAGLWCAVRDRGERIQFIASLGKKILRSSRKTNDISGTYLSHAIRGQVSNRLADLAEAIGHGENSQHLIQIAETAMRVGHTSGMDAVTGLLIGLAAWEGGHLLPF